MSTKVDFTVVGGQRIHCAGWKERIARALSRLPGVEAVTASAETQRVTVTLDPSQAETAKLQQKLGQLGYRVRFGGDRA